MIVLVYDKKANVMPFQQVIPHTGLYNIRNIVYMVRIKSKYLFMSIFLSKVFLIAFKFQYVTTICAVNFYCYFDFWSFHCWLILYDNIPLSHIESSNDPSEGAQGCTSPEAEWWTISIGRTEGTASRSWRITPRHTHIARGAYSNPPFGFWENYISHRNSADSAGIGGIGRRIWSVA